MSTAATSFAITELSAVEILDSRGNPTPQVDVTLGSGSPVAANPPTPHVSARHHRRA